MIYAVPNFPNGICQTIYGIPNFPNGIYQTIYATPIFVTVVRNIFDDAAAFILAKSAPEIRAITMIKITRFFENHLANREISAEELRQFAEDHLGKLAALTAAPAEITALAAPTDDAFGEFDEKLSARTTLLAAQSADTITKDDAVKLIRSTLRQREGLISNTFPKASAGYAEFFPGGLKEIGSARIGQIPGILDRVITAATKHQSALGAALLTELTTLKTTYTNARSGQVDAKGELAAARDALATARTALELQLGRNILAIASYHLGAPEKAKVYFNQSLLEDPTRSDDTPTSANPQT